MPKRRVLDSLVEPPLVMGQNAIFVGDLHGDDSYVVHGEVYGSGNIRGALLLAADCQWCGDVTADVVVVKGRVEGDIEARHKIELRDGARVSGDISAPVIAISHGAVLRGAVAEHCLVSHFPERRQ